MKFNEIKSAEKWKKIVSKSENHLENPLLGVVLATKKE